MISQPPACACITAPRVWNIMPWIPLGPTPMWMVSFSIYITFLYIPA